MPYSSSEGSEWALERVALLNPATVLDIGPGAGKWGKLLRETGRPFEAIDCIEVWAPYVDQFGLKDIYDTVMVADAAIVLPPHEYDLVIFGDVVEHMTADRAKAMVDRLVTKAGIIALPIVESIQGEWEGNPYEAHVEQWTLDRVLRTFIVSSFFEGTQIGVFVVRPEPEP